MRVKAQTRLTNCSFASSGNTLSPGSIQSLRDAPTPQTKYRHHRDAHVLWPLRDNPLSNRIEHDLGRVVQIELLHEIRAMGLDRR